MFNLSRWYEDNPKTAVNLANFAVGLGITVLAVGITLAVVGSGGLAAGFICAGLVGALVSNVIRKAVVLDQEETKARKVSKPKVQQQKNIEVKPCPEKKAGSKFNLFKHFLHRTTSTSSSTNQTVSPAPMASRCSN